MPNFMWSNYFVSNDDEGWSENTFWSFADIDTAASTLGGVTLDTRLACLLGLVT
jgi:hypothetical protein